MATAKLDLVIQKGTTFRRGFQLKQSDGTPINLTGFMICGQMRHLSDSPSYVSLGVTVVDAWTANSTPPTSAYV